MKDAHSANFIGLFGSNICINNFWTVTFLPAHPGYSLCESGLVVESNAVSEVGDADIH